MAELSNPTDGICGRLLADRQHPATRRRLSGWPANRRKAVVTYRQSWVVSCLRAGPGAACWLWTQF